MAIVPNLLPKHGEARSDTVLQSSQQVNLADPSLERDVQALVLKFRAIGSCSITIGTPSTNEADELGTEYQDLTINLSDGDRYVIILSRATSPGIFTDDNRINISATNPTNAHVNAIGFSQSLIALSHKAF